MQQEQTLHMDIFKKHKINDVILYAQKYKKYINNDFLKQQGFSFEDINIIMYNFKEEILELNNKWLIRENRKLKNQLLETKPKIISKKDNTKVLEEIIEKENDYYKLTIIYNKKHRAKQTHKILIKNVKLIHKLIKKLSSKNRLKIGYRDIVPLVINAHKLDNISVDAFSGGTNRKYYFGLYKFPLRILRIQGLIKTDFRGNIWINNN